MRTTGVLPASPLCRPTRDDPIASYTALVAVHPAGGDIRPGRSAPEAAKGNRPETITEREAVGTGVQDDAALEAVTELVT